MTTAAVVGLLSSRLADDQIAGAAENLHRLPTAMHRAVLAEMHIRMDLDRAEAAVLGAGGGL